MHRLILSKHVDTITGWIAITIGVFVALCVIVGLAVMLNLIAEAVT